MVFEIYFDDLKEDAQEAFLDQLHESGIALDDYDLPDWAYEPLAIVEIDR